MSSLVYGIRFTVFSWLTQTVNRKLNTVNCQHSAAYTPKYCRAAVCQEN
jgi:hypothetical protein